MSSQEALLGRGRALLIVVILLLVLLLAFPLLFPLLSFPKSEPKVISEVSEGLNTRSISSCAFFSTYE